MFANHIERTKIASLPLTAFEGTIHLVEDMPALRRALDSLKKLKIVGFDTETRPSFKKGKLNTISLIQLASHDEVWLLRLHKLSIRKELNGLFSSSSILKVGVGIRDDIRSLRPFCKTNPESFIDLQDLAGTYGIMDVSLKKLAAIVLGVRVSKSQQLSNWELEELTDSQLLYAATDAWIPLEIYTKLIRFAGQQPHGSQSFQT